MSRPIPYFMKDQVRHRVARIMRDHDRSPMAAPVWPLVVAIAALTFINVLTAIPKP